MSSKIYPIGIQSFEKIRKDGYFYIDKTALVYQMVKTGSYYLLSRPRRFGKSLLLSTLEAYFQDLNSRNYENKNSLLEELNKHLEIWERAYNSPYGNRAPEERFYQVIRLAAEQTGQPVVILVDEYDKPLLQTIGNKELQASYRSILKPFYGVLKSMDKFIKFALLTGVTKFGKVSVFSDLNNLDDISMREPYISLCGMTEKEIHDNLEIELHELATTLNITFEKVCSKLKEYYDGYHFVENTEGIYNPFSLLNTFKYNKFSNYWFETGTPTYLVELLKQNHYDLERMAHEEIDIPSIDTTCLMFPEPIPILYQYGYLTIKDHDEKFELYQLGIPNREIKEGILNFSAQTRNNEKWIVE